MLKLTSKTKRKLKSRWTSPVEESASGKAPKVRRRLPRGPKEAPQDGRVPIAKTWKQPKCPLTDEWIKKLTHI